MADVVVLNIQLRAALKPLTTHNKSPGMVLRRRLIPWEDFFEFG
jgi:hypothetical protein